MTDYPNANSDAANAYATSYARAGGYRPWSPRHSEFAAAFDAGCAHALATITPRTISTAAELDAQTRLWSKSRDQIQTSREYPSN